MLVIDQYPDCATFERFHPIDAVGMADLAMRSCRGRRRLPTSWCQSPVVIVGLAARSLTIAGVSVIHADIMRVAARLKPNDMSRGGDDLNTLGVRVYWLAYARKRARADDHLK
jgi:hypothetical protein